MQIPKPTRFLALLGFALCSPLYGQTPLAPPLASQLPSTAPTLLSPVPPAPQPPPTPPVHRADVAYDNGKLSVSANNSSLNQILREVSRQTGMKITGGVSDEHVFGKYGPAPTAQVLATLLDGTGSNMFLVQNGSAAPVELILTARTGGVTPPNPNAASLNNSDDDDAPPRSPERFINRAPRQPSDFNSNRPEEQPSLLPPPSPPDTSQDPATTGARTPQQIYDQLMRMRQQTQQATPTPAPQ